MNQLEKEGIKPFKLRDELEENNDKRDILSFRLSSNTITIPFLQLFKYSEIIREEYINNHIISNLSGKLAEFQKQGCIKEESIKLFFKMLQDEEIQISCNQYCDFCKLSEIFKVNSLQKYLSKYTKQHSHDIDFIINLMINQNTTENDPLLSNDKYSSEMEEILISNVDQCLKNQQFGKLPISTIYRIIEKSDIQKVSSDALYDFIVDSISERFTLFNFLNLQNMSDSKLNEMCQNYHDDSKSSKYFQYLPCNLKYIKELRESKQSLEKAVLELQKEKNEFQNQINILTNENIQRQNMIKNLENNQRKLQKQIDNLSENNCQLEAQNKKSEEKIKELQEQISKLKIVEDEKNQLQSSHEKVLIRVEELEKANINSYFEVIKSFISYINDIDKNLYAKKSILHYACELNNLDVIKYIVSLKNIGLDSRDYFGKSILHIACKFSCTDIVKYLISINESGIQSKCCNEKNILHYACESGNLELVKYILSLKKIDVCSRSKDGKTILHSACESGNLELVKFILSLNKIDINSIDQNGKNILHSSCESGNIEVVEFILSFNKIDINAKYKHHYDDKYYYIHNFEYYNKEDKFRNEHESSFEEKAALHIAVEKENIKIVQLLLSNPNIDINIKMLNNYEKYNPNSDWMNTSKNIIEKTSLHIAIENENLEIIQCLLSNAKIDINAKFISSTTYLTPKGDRSYEKKIEKTALHISVEKNNAEIVRNLISNQSIEVNMKYTKEERYDYNDHKLEEKYALYMAVDVNNAEIVKLLLSSPKINVNAKYLYTRSDYLSGHYRGERNEKSALYLAIENDANEIAESLLQIPNINVNDVYKHYNDNYGSSKPVLHLAVEKKNIKIIQLLMKNKNIDKYIKDSNNRYPIDIANDSEIKALIK